MGYIVIERPGKIKNIAKGAMRGRFLRLCAGFLIYFLLMDGLAAVLDQVFCNPHVYQVLGKSYTVNLSYVGYAFRLLVEGPLALGLSVYGLHFFRTGSVDSRLVLTGFRRTLKSTALAVRIYFSVLIGTVLLVVPGFIAWFDRSQAFYIMADNPGMSPAECIRASKKMMRGNKARLFGLYASFILWFLLAGLVGGLILDIPAEGNSVLLRKIVSSAVMIPLNAFLHVSATVFYELAAENLVLVRKTDAENSQFC